ncbi:MAG: LacI family transcriptional regulator [Chloroflexi bacterium]|nr:LacI family transcriptional regulator [Chloroflexota bacterium]
MITMRDVAEHAGVSVATVSHVINDTRPVSDHLRMRVQGSMNQLGYQPNRLARSLRRGKTHTIGMIVADSANPFFAEVARGVEDTTFGHNHSLILCNSDGDLDKELFYVNRLAEKQVDGILFVAAGVSGEHILALQRRFLPVVVIDRDLPDVAVDSVFTDNRRGGYLVTQHLLALGHRRIACVTGPSDVTPSADRVAGYRRALQDAGIDVDERLVIRGDFDYESGYGAVEQFLKSKPGPSALFACNDLMAMGAISAATKMGLHVPADLSIVGYDDVRLASFTVPPLTTIEQPKHEIGVLAATLLFQRIQQPDLPPRRRLLETSLKIRQSTAPPTNS